MKILSIVIVIGIVIAVLAVLYFAVDALLFRDYLYDTFNRGELYCPDFREFCGFCFNFCMFGGE